MTLFKLPMFLCGLLILLNLCSFSTFAFQTVPTNSNVSTKRVGFVPLAKTNTLQHQFRKNIKYFMATSNDNKDVSAENDVSSRLLAESIAPWRTLRVFLYFALGSGALLGGFITLTGVFASLSRGSTEIDLNSNYLDLAIDFGAAIAFAVFAKLDFDKGNELNTKVEGKLEKKKEDIWIRTSMKERELTLSSLEIELRVSDDGTMQRANIGAVQAGAKQHLIIVAGRRKAIRDALLGANLLKMDFAIKDVLVIPYELDKKRGEEKMRPDGTGFTMDKRPNWESAPYVAQCVGKGWDAYINAEVEDAVKQNSQKVKDDGIVIVVENTGKIVKRGVGQIPWRDTVGELEKQEKAEPSLDLNFLD